ncbi:putative 2-aminoethylphosphonate ABC transporter permease subunit [Alphaproteobacteria bacterium]|jgi:iron(III) transport system permease protein|nr:putative 2-aminoethylphosphonate ABC transporter permease subunit [Alphaproteobacteria bacterium]MDB2635750.1 putative 2-aminoethylphosphonate ABC transporter permease subunit [Alphaproteobacteria bacterium]
MKKSRDDYLTLFFISIIGFYIFIALAFPMYAILSKSFENKDGAFIGFENYQSYFENSSLVYSIYNSLFISIVTMVITISLAFVFAYALTKSRMAGKGVFRSIAMIPILVPSLLSGISLIYLFGKQGIFRELLMGYEIYGPIGIIIAEVFYTFPHALLIIVTALSIGDARLYEAAKVLRSKSIRTFFTVTLPSAKYGVISAAFVVFTLVITDFGIPKVIGGNYNVLAVDVYKQVIGQQNFEMGAVVSMVLVFPALIAFAVDRIVQRKQVAILTSRSVVHEPNESKTFDRVMFGYCSAISVLILTILGMCFYASLVTFWPYNLTLSLKNYQFDLMDGGGWDSYYNSIRMACYTAFFGTIVVFAGAYFVEKSRGLKTGRSILHLLSMMPMAIPGLVLGLAYIFFFNHPDNPLNFLYGTMAILVICTITHFYTVSHLTALTSLKQIDNEFEHVSSSLKQPFYKTLFRVTVPISLPAIFEIGIYFFVNAMTTVSAVVFLYSSKTTLASVAVLNMDDAGDIAPAAAMGMMIFYTNAAVRIVYVIATKKILVRFQNWRKKTS